jgi:hypothetical protein
VCLFPFRSLNLVKICPSFGLPKSREPLPKKQSSPIIPHLGLQAMFTLSTNAHKVFTHVQKFNSLYKNEHIYVDYIHHPWSIWLSHVESWFATKCLCNFTYITKAILVVNVANWHFPSRAKKTFGGIGSKHQHLIKFNIQQAKGLDIN